MHMWRVRGHHVGFISLLPPCEVLGIELRLSGLEQAPHLLGQLTGTETRLVRSRELIYKD